MKVMATPPRWVRAPDAPAPCRRRSACAAPCADRRSAGSHRPDRRRSTAPARRSPPRRSAANSASSCCCAAATKRSPEASVAGVDEHLLAALGVLERQHADVGQGVVERIDQPHRQHLVPPGQHRQPLLPARRRDEVGQHEQDRAPLDRAERLAEERPEIGLGRAQQPRVGLDPVRSGAARARVRRAAARRTGSTPS